MSDRTPRRWRWLTAGGVLAISVFGFGAILRARSLETAANVAQLVSLLPFGVALIEWARRYRPPDAATAEHGMRLGDLLRTIADAHGLTASDVREALRDRESESVDAYFNGTSIPRWSFVSAFLDVVAEDDRWRRELLIRKVRPIWEAASRDGALAAPVADAENWAAALREAVEASRAAAEVEDSAERNESINTGLLEMIRRLTRTVRDLTEERDSLRAQLHAKLALIEADRVAGEAVRAQLKDVRRQLADLRDRLHAAEKLQREAEHRLKTSGQQLADAERLRRQVAERQRIARQRLIEFYPSPPMLPQTQSSTPDEVQTFTLMGPPDQRMGEEILQKVDALLEKEANTLEALRRNISTSRLPKSASSSQKTDRPHRRALPKAATATVVVLLIATVGVLAKDSIFAGKARVQQPKFLLVPPLRGYDEQAAAAALARISVKYTVVQEFSTTVVQGRVISTDPQAGKPILPSDVVKIHLSAGPANVTIPPLDGLTEDAAREALEKSGLKVKVERRSSNKDQGKVYDSKPADGDLVPPGTTVRIYLPERDAKIPNVVGRGLGNARRMLEKISFVVSVRWQHSTSPAGLVIWQSITSGVRRPKGTTITLTASSGPLQPTHRPSPASPSDKASGDDPFGNSDVDDPFGN